MKTAEQHAQAVRNAAYMVRYYGRGARSRIQRSQRTAAVHALGLTVRQAFNESNDFEPLLAAIVDGLRPREEPPF